MPIYPWHEKKKLHDFQVSQYLSKVPSSYVDWEIVTLFYSSLHYVDSYLSEEFGLHYIYEHKQRKPLIQSLVSVVERDYRMLYHLGQDARYNDVQIGASELASAKQHYSAIKFRLTPVICSKCGYKNLLNTGKCQTCQSAI